MIPERIHYAACIIAFAIIFIIAWKAPIFTKPSAAMIEAMR